VGFGFLGEVRGVPLIYFYGVERGMYRPAWPVFIVGEDSPDLAFHVAIDEQSQVAGTAE